MAILLRNLLHKAKFDGSRSHFIERITLYIRLATKKMLLWNNRNMKS